jgi:hypothetical protein
MAEREQLLSNFVDWAHQHITGDEKGQAQIFLDRLFQAFGEKGCLGFGGAAETRIRKVSEDGGGISLGRARDARRRNVTAGQQSTA